MRFVDASHNMQLSKNQIERFIQYFRWYMLDKPARYMDVWPKMTPLSAYGSRKEKTSVPRVSLFTPQYFDSDFLAVFRAQIYNAFTPLLSLFGIYFLALKDLPMHVPMD